MQELNGGDAKIIKLMALEGNRKYSLIKNTSRPMKMNLLYNFLS